MRLRRSTLALFLALLWSPHALAGDVASTPAFLFIPNAINDESFSQAAYQGYQTLARQGFKISYQASIDDLSPAQRMALVDANYARGVRAFIVVGAELSDFATAAAKKYPDAKFATVSGTATGHNVIDYCLDCLSPGGLLAGQAALELSKTDVMGFVGGLASVDGREAQRFQSTILAAKPQAKVLIDWTNDWDDLAAAGKLTDEQIGKGADVEYATVNTGVITAAEKHPGVKVIGALVDVSSLSKSVAASVVIRTDVVYRMFLDVVAGGMFKPGVYEATATDGTWEIVRTP